MADRPAGTGTGVGPHDAVGRALNDPGPRRPGRYARGGGSVPLDVDAEQPDEFGRDVAEVTDRMLFYSQRHLRTVLAEYEAHYNGRRPHRGRQLRPPRPDHPAADLSRKRIQRRPVLGGLINEYQRAV